MKLLSTRKLSNEEATKTKTFLNDGLFTGRIAHIRQEVINGIHNIELPDTEGTKPYYDALVGSGLFK